MRNSVMSDSKLNKILWALVPVVIALISVLVISRFVTSPRFYSSYIDSLDDKRSTVMEMTAASTAASAAISFLPDDKGTPVAEQLVKLSTGFLIVVAALTLEKYLLVLTGHLAFSILIPCACLLITLALISEKTRLKEISIKLAGKLILFSLAVFLVVPLSIKASDLIEKTYTGAMENTLEQVTNATETINEALAEESESGGSWLEKQWSELTSGIKTQVNKMVGDAQNVVNDLLEALAVMIVTSCLIPVLILVFILWLCKVILGVNIDIILKPD